MIILDAGFLTQAHLQDGLAGPFFMWVPFHSFCFLSANIMWLVDIINACNWDLKKCQMTPMKLDISDGNINV